MNYIWDVYCTHKGHIQEMKCPMWSDALPSFHSATRANTDLLYTLMPGDLHPPQHQQTRFPAVTLIEKWFKNLLEFGRRWCPRPASRYVSNLAHCTIRIATVWKNKKLNKKPGAFRESFTHGHIHLPLHQMKHYAAADNMLGDSISGIPLIRAPVSVSKYFTYLFNKSYFNTHRT